MPQSDDHRTMPSLEGLRFAFKYGRSPKRKGDIELPKRADRPRDPRLPTPKGVDAMKDHTRRNREALEGLLP